MSLWAKAMLVKHMPSCPPYEGEIYLLQTKACVGIGKQNLPFFHFTVLQSIAFKQLLPSLVPVLTMKNKSAKNGGKEWVLPTSLTFLWVKKKK